MLNTIIKQASPISLDTVCSMVEVTRIGFGPTVIVVLGSSVKVIENESGLIGA